MIVTFRSDAGPIEGFTRATFRSAINDEGFGEIEGPPETLDAISGSIVCEVDGGEVFRWEPEDRTLRANDHDLLTLSGRSRSAALERAIVLPVGYPSFTQRTRTETGAPFAIFATLLSEAQARGRLAGLTPTWTATHDSNGVPWEETISVQLEPGTHLRDLIEQFAEVEGAEWIIRPNGQIDAAKELGADRSGEIVLFLGRDQVSRQRRSTSRDQRQIVYIEASTGVSEAANTTSADAGEIWLEAQDYADQISRQALADKLAQKLSDPTEEAEIEIASEAGAFTQFFPGDRVGLDAGGGAPEKVRLVSLIVEVSDTVETKVTGTLITEVALRQRRIDQAIEAKADVQLAATPVIQRRHGLVTADKFLSGAVGDQVAISSENYIPGSQGWVIRGDGDAEFNTVVIRGDLESNNYVEGVSGWRLDQEGDAELNEGRFRGLITGSAFTTADGTGAGHIVISGDPALDPESPGFNQIAFIPDEDFFPPGSYGAPALIQVLDTGGMSLTSVSGTGLADFTGLILGTNGVTLTSGPNGFLGINVDAPDGFISLFTPFGVNLDLGTNLTVTGTSSLRATTTHDLAADGTTRSITGYRDVSLTRDLSVGRNITAGSITSGFGNINIGTSIFSGDGSGLFNLPIPPLPTDPTFNSVRVNTSVFFNTTSFPRFETSGSSVLLRGTGRLRMKFDAGFEVEDGPILFEGGSISPAGNAEFQSVSGLDVTAQIALFTDRNDTTTLATNARISTATGRIQRSTSSRRYKQDIQDASLMPSVLEVRPVTFRGIHDVEANGDDATVIYGAIAEEVHDLGLTFLVEYLGGEPESLHYDRFAIALIPHVRALRDRIERLEEEIRGD